jgi:hypothetical protein
MEHKFWDVGAKFVTRPPNLGKASTARVMQALIKLKGRLHSAFFFGTNDMPDHYRDGVYRISLPVGSEEKFEEMTGYQLTPPIKVSV